MALVTYSDSSDEDEPEPPNKKPKREAPPFEQVPAAPAARPVSSGLPSKSLPPLPPTFLDLYSSTVRNSTQDDPALHGGRKRVKPHVVGNWPAHVYVEWYPTSEEDALLSSIVEFEKVCNGSESGGEEEREQSEVHSLLKNDLGVPLPLHISLSRPLTLQSGEKDSFLDRMREAILASGFHAFDCQVKTVYWHANESSTRYFFVLGVDATDELRGLLRASNRIARVFGQPRLYAPDDGSDEIHDRFHVSLAWTLGQPQMTVQGLRQALRKVRGMRIPVSTVKVRIGQDVTTVALPAARKPSIHNGGVKEEKKMFC